MISPEFQDAMDKIDAATTAAGTGATAVSNAVDGVSVRFDALKNQIKTSMTADEVAAVKAKIDDETTKLDAVVTFQDQLATALNGIGTEPTNPVPEPVPQPPTV